MKKYLLFALLAIICANKSFAQASTANYAFTPGNTGSLVLDLNGNAIDLSTGATSLVAASVDDGPASAVTPIPFDFWFMGNRYTSYGATANGMLSLGAAPSGTLYILPNGTTPTLTAFGNDTRVGTDGEVRGKVFGTAPNRVYVVEWSKIMIRYNGTNLEPGTGTWQIRMYENTGIIEYVYGTMNTNAGSPTVYYTGFSSNTTVNNMLTVNTAPVAVASTSATAISNSYTANSTITALSSAADGSRVNYKFASPIPNAPTASTAAGGITTALINWTDNSTNETGFVIYTSTDGINYNFYTQTAINATSFFLTGLTSGTPYYYKVYAVTEGALSATAASGTFTTSTACSFTGTKTVGPTGDFATIQAAVYFMINSGLTGPAAIELQAGYVSSGETFPVTVYAIPCASATNTLTIRPQAPLLISGSNATALFDLNTANYVTIDGRVGSTGATGVLNISNTGSGAAVRFINDASNNALVYDTLTSTETSTTSGVVFFSTTNATTGNDNNFIGNSVIMDGATQPANGIYSSGTTGKENDHNIIANNSIANFFSAGSASNGIFLTGGNTDWTITSNKFYQSATRTYTSGNTHRGIQINNTSGNNFVVTNNTIGYATATGTGVYTMAGNVANVFQGISLSVGTTTASTVQANTITAMNVSGSTGAFTGIAVTNGNVNVGTGTANTIGATGAVDAIVKNNTSNTNPSIIGISASSGGTVAIQNNNIGGLTAIGSSATIGTGIAGVVASSGTVTITGNIIGSTTIANSINASVASTATGTVYGINGSTGTGISITNNTIANLNNNSTATGSLTAGILYSSNATGAVINSNTIHDVYGATASTTITGQEGVCGIAFTGSAATPDITLNTIYAIAATNTGTVTSNAAGIGITSATNATVTRNRIYDIRNASTGTTATTPPTADGIVVGNVSTGITVANNMVALGDAQTTNTSFTGIMNSATTSATVKIYFNSVSIAGTASSGALASAGIHRGNYSTTAVTSAVDIRNNISVNTRNGGTGKHYAIANGINVVASSATGWASNASNFNIWNAAAGTVGYWSGDRTFAAWQTASLSDGNSYGNTAVTFVNTATGDLHINMGTVANNIESHGVAISGLSTDFDNDTRPGPIGSINGGGTGPDIGADEFDGTLVDNIPPAIAYTPFLGTCIIGDRTITVTISDASGVPAAGSGTEPRIYFKKNTGAYASVAGTLSSGTLLNGVWSFTIPAATLGTLNPGDHIYYYVVAQDVFANVGASPSAGFTATDVNTITTAPAAPSSYSILPGSGTFTVGIGGTYTTITEAINAYDSACLAGPVVLNLTDATYPTETYPFVITNAGASAVNTLTIKPATGVAVTITGAASATAIFKLVDARYVTIDGVNTGGSSLSLVNTNTGTAAAIWLASNTTGNNNIALKNMAITGGSNTTTNDWGILSGANGTTAGSGAGADNDNITVQGNTFVTCGYGIYGQGTNSASAGGLDNWTITGNTFGPDATGAATAYIGYNGIYMNNGLNFIISNNTFRNIGTATLTSQTVGINLSSNVNGFTIDGNNINNVKCASTTYSNNSVAGISLGTAVVNGTVTKNTINDIYNYTTNGYGSRGLILNSGTAGSNIVVANNIIFNIYCYSDASILYWNGGIDLEGTMSGVKIYDNTVALTGTFAGYTSATGSAALMVNSGVSGLNVRDNIFVNTYNNTVSSTDKGWAIYSAASASAYDTIDYNDYYAASPDVLGYLGGDQTTFAALQTAFGGNTHSLSFLPFFVSATDFHLQAAGTNAALYIGIPLPGITTDINGTTRGLTTTVVGAHEAAIPTCGVVTGGVATPVVPSFCVTGATTINLVGASSGLGTGTQWFSSSDSATFTAIAGATNTSYTITPAITATTYYRVVTTCSFSGNHDSASTVISVYGLPTIAVTPDGGTICTGTGITLTASGAATYSWAPAASLSAATGAAVTATPTITTAYVVTGTDLHGCVNTHTSTVVVNFTPAAITFTPALPAICVGSSVSVTATANVSGPAVAISQDFNSGLGSWTVDNTGTTDFDAYAPWQIHVDGYVSPEGDTYHSPDNSQFVSTNSDHNGTGTTDISKIVSPSFSLANYTVAAVTFDQYYRYYGTGDHSMTVDISTDGGSTWTVVHDYIGATIGTLTGFVSTNLDLSAYTGQTNVKLRWNYNSSFGYYWAIDNISVAGTLSTPASNITWSPATGLFTDAALTTPYTGTAAATVYAAPAISTPYTVTAVNAGCSTTGNVTVTVNPLPLPYALTGGGHYCAGGTGVVVGLSNSEVGVSYQLFNTATATDTAVTGTGSAISFGLHTAAGAYTVVATNAATGCTNNMTGSSSITIDPLPLPFTVSGGGAYCTGGAGMVINLDNSTLGISYQLYLGATAVGPAVTGTGAGINFGAQTTAGTYTVVATNTVTTCTNNMTGSATISINALPAVYAVSGSGSYCAGGTGVAVTLANSETGVSYQLYAGATAVGAAVAGTGSGISFGLQTTAATYTVVATNITTACTSNMTGSAVITIDPLPVAFAVAGGGHYCTGSAGVAITLPNSAVGVNYQLFNGATAVGTAVAGTGTGISFGLQTAAGTYTVVAANATTACTSNMTGSVTVTIDPLPTAFALTGSGAYCPTSTGAVIGLSSSEAGVAYQLYLGTTAVGTPVAGTGSAISFSPQTTIGTYTVVATNSTSACTNNMTGSVTTSISPVPNIYTTTGGGGYCAGGTGVAVSLSNSDLGVDYQLFNGSSPVGSPVAGTGSALNFGLQTVAGTYAVQATNTTTTCTSNMNGFPVVTITPLPAAFAVTGGGGYCSGGTGMTVGLGNSTVGVNYQLYNGTTAVGLPVAGNGLAISFGLQTTAGTYTVVATDGVSACTSNMTGSATITVNPLPVAFTVTGGGAYCAGGTGMVVGLGNSATGVTYQLYAGTTALGSPVSGTGSAISFGLQTTTGTYTVVATNTATTCTNNMTGSVVISTTPLPLAYSVTGGGGYCAGGTGMVVGLSNSDLGINYQLFSGATAIGTSIAGTGAAISFGLQTAAGTYTVVATNTTTTCTNNMTGSAIITINALPAAFAVTGGGVYCTGGTGSVVGLGNSTLGVTYQLYAGATAVGAPVAGTGLAISFGPQTATGTYTVVATNTVTTCTNNMTGSVSVSTSTPPLTFTVTGGGSYCAGGTGMAVGLSNSETGISYQLFVGTTAVGTPVAGTGAAISFGLQTTAGTYTVVATSAGTCTSTMTGSVTITISPLPLAYTVTGGGGYCVGGTGMAVGLSNSDLGVTYQLYNGATATGTPVAGTGAAISFGLQTAAGTYTVVATNGTSACTSNMTGSATITINALPLAYNVTGGGAYCAGGTGFAVGLGNSDLGVTYQLYNGAVTVGAPVAGTGAAISFGAMATAGTYTVVATNTTTTCTSNMTGSAIITVNPLPLVYTVSGGGSYCSGGTGVSISLGNSETGVNYQLYVGATATGTPVAGTGAGINLGLQTTAGIYTVVATNAITGCTNNMSGSATVSVTTPVAVSVTLSAGVSDTVCSGASTTLTATPVNGGTTPVYQWTVNGVVTTATGSTYSYVPVGGDVVIVTLTSSMACVIATSASDTTTITTATNVTPLVSITAAPGTTVCDGTTVTYTATAVFGGTAPTYSWMVNGVAVATGATYAYIPVNGDVVSVLMHSNFPCRAIDSAFSNTFTMVVNPVLTPIVTITAAPGTTIAVGETLTLTSGVISGGSAPAYQWYINGAAISGATNATYTGSSFADNDSVSVIVTPGGLCGTAVENHVIIHVTNGVNSVSVRSANISLMPNPNNGTFNVKGSLAVATDQEATIEVTDMLGQVVYSRKVTVQNGAVNEVIQLDGIVANGTYLLNFRSGTQLAQFHFILNR